ncbi:phosphotransferase [Arthrobacter luteolus]|uniref:phosphotransferase n=1 Tax=Arthrobacter luteolus TaxID=98672 RepID=UPI00384ECF5C
MAVPLAELLTAGGLVLHSFNHERTFDRPGAGVTVLFRIQAVDQDGAEITVYAGATTSPAAARGPALRTSLSGTQLFLWLHPRDPLLPDLAWALSPEDLARDVFAPGTSPAGVGVRVTGYRPLRRAVVHAASALDGVYLKVVLPGQAEELRHRHRLLAASAVPAAALRPGPAHRSAVVLEQLTGTPLLRGLAAGSHGLSAGDLTGLLDELPAAALDLRRRPAWAERSRAYGQAAAALLPGQRMRVQALAAGVESLVAELDPGPVVPVHGDFYEGNLLAAAGRITGVLDVDGLGPGHRVDDLACFIGHLAVLARLSPDSALPGELAAFQAGFESAAAAAGSSPAALNARAAGVALSLVPGARAGRLDRESNALARLEAAEHLLAQALGRAA